MGRPQYVDQNTIDIATMKERLDNLCERSERIEKMLETHIEYCENGMDKRYASKIVEKIVYGATALILTGVFTALVALVLNKPT